MSREEDLRELMQARQAGTITRDEYLEARKFFASPPSSSEITGVRTVFKIDEALYARYPDGLPDGDYVTTLEGAHRSESGEWAMVYRVTARRGEGDWFRPIDSGEKPIRTVGRKP